MDNSFDDTYDNYYREKRDPMFTNFWREDEGLLKSQLTNRSYSKSLYDNTEALLFHNPEYDSYPTTQQDPKNVKLLQNGSQTMIQLSIEQLQQFMTKNPPDTSVPTSYVSSYELPSRDFPVQRGSMDDNSFMCDISESDDMKNSPISDKKYSKKVGNGTKKTPGHHIVERRYRQNLNDKISHLKNLVFGPSPKVSKGAILDEAVSTILKLRNKVEKLNQRIFEMQSPPQRSSPSTDESPGNQIGGHLSRSNVGFVECGRLLCLFFVFAVFWVNPFSYLLQSRSDVAFFLSSVFEEQKVGTTRSLLAHGDTDVWQVGAFELAKSLSLWIMAHVLNGFLFFVFILNFVVISTSWVTKDSIAEAGLHLQKAHKLWRQSDVVECERTIADSLTCLGISTPSLPFQRWVKMSLSFLCCVVSYVFGPLVKYPSFYRSLVFSSRDYNHLADYVRQLSEVYVLQGLVFLQRGATNPHNDSISLMNLISTASLSGDASLRVQLYSLASLGVRQFLPRQLYFLINQLRYRAASNAQHEVDKLLVELVSQIDGWERSLMSPATDFKSLIFLYYVDLQLVECLKGRCIQDGESAMLSNIMDRLDGMPCTSHDAINYRRSIVELLVYRTTRTKRKQSKMPQVMVLSNRADSVMKCAHLIIYVDSQLHCCEPSRLPFLLELCVKANKLLVNCGKSESKLAKHFEIFVWEWMLSIRHDVLSYVECVVPTSPGTLSLFENDFKEMVSRAYQLDCRLINRMAVLSRAWTLL